MNLKEQLKAKQAELKALKDGIEAGDKDVIAKAGEIADAIKELEASIASAEKANEILRAIGTPASEEVAEEVSNTDTAKSIAAKVKGIKSNGGWSVSGHIKAATDPITSIENYELDRQVEPSTKKVKRLSDLFPQAVVSEEASGVSYVTQDAVEGSAANVTEGSAKPQISTGFTVNHKGMIKVAVYTKETAEAKKQSSILESTIDETVNNSLLKQENVDVITEITSNTSSTDAEYTVDSQDANATTRAYMEAILEAKSQIEDDTDYDADLVLMNPKDFYKMAIAKDSNGQYMSGGWASGAYGNGSYSSTVTPWGLVAFTSKSVTEGDAYVLSTSACKVYKQGDIEVRVFDQNEDDAKKNLIMIRAEEYILPVVRNAKAVVKVTPAE